MGRTDRRTEPAVLTSQQPHASAGDTLTGVIARVVQDRGFCFIHSGGQDYFCHFTALQNGKQLNELVQGVSKVKFVVNETAKGLRAERVEVL